MFRARNDDESFYALLKLQKVITKEDWIELLLKVKLPEVLSGVLDQCSDSKIANEGVNLLVDAFKNETFFNQFIESNETKAVLESISKFGSTSMSKAIECLTLLLKKAPTIISPEIIVKIAPFLATSDLNLRKEAAELLIYLIDKKLFDNESSLTAVVHNMLMKVMPESTDSLLMSIPELLKRLTNLSHPLESIRSSLDGPRKILELTIHQNSEIALNALTLMRIVVEGLFPAPLDIVQCLINYFPHIVGRSNTITETSLFVLALLMRSQHTYK